MPKRRRLLPVVPIQDRYRANWGLITYSLGYDDHAGDNLRCLHKFASTCNPGPWTQDLGSRLSRKRRANERTNKLWKRAAAAPSERERDDQGEEAGELERIGEAAAAVESVRACHCSYVRQTAGCIIMGCHLISSARGRGNE